MGKKSELYKAWRTGKKELKDAIISKLEPYNISAVATRVDNFLESLGDELGKAAMDEQHAEEDGEPAT